MIPFNDHRIKDGNPRHRNERRKFILDIKE